MQFFILFKKTNINQKRKGTPRNQNPRKIPLPQLSVPPSSTNKKQRQEKKRIRKKIIEEAQDFLSTENKKPSAPQSEPFEEPDKV